MVLVLQQEVCGNDVISCCPGNVIPKWFNYQEEGSSISIKLPQQWYNATFLGFVTCAVAAFEGNCSKCCHPLNVRCRFSLRGQNGETSNLRLVVHTPFPEVQVPKVFGILDHVHVFYR